MEMSQTSGTTYFMHTPELAEIARLLNQDHLVTSAVSLLPAPMDVTSLGRVLDIGCGPGGWLLDLIAPRDAQRDGITDPKRLAKT